MAVSVKNKMKGGFSYDYSRDTSNASAVYICEGTDLSVWNGDTVAAHAAGIPDTGDTMVVNGRTLRFKNKTTSRLGPDLVDVTCNYEWNRYDGGDDEPNEDEVNRRRYYGVPYAEKLSLFGEEEMQHFEIDAAGANTGVSIGAQGEGAPVFRARGSWSFTVNIRPVESMWSLVDRYNDAIYPPGGTTIMRPFAFNTGTLLYRGAEGGPADRGTVYTPLDIPFTWVWALTFTFDLNPYTWIYYKWTITDTVDVGAGATTLYYWDPIAHAEVPHVDDGKRIVNLYPTSGDPTNWLYTSCVRRSADFTTWGFDWTV